MILPPSAAFPETTVEDVRAQPVAGLQYTFNEGFRELLLECLFTRIRSFYNVLAKPVALVALHTENQGN